MIAAQNSRVQFVGLVLDTLILVKMSNKLLIPILKRERGAKTKKKTA